MKKNINKKNDESGDYQLRNIDSMISEENVDGKRKRRKRREGDEYDEDEEDEEQDEPENEIIDVNREEDAEDADEGHAIKRRASAASVIQKTAPIPPYSSMFIFSPTSKYVLDFRCFKVNFKLEKN